MLKRKRCRDSPHSEQASGQQPLPRRLTKLLLLAREGAEAYAKLPQLLVVHG
jgi:hypothetical protein